MRTSAFFLCICAFVFGASALFAQAPATGQKLVGGELPHFILVGFQTYKDRGPDEAVRVWTKGGPIDGSKEMLNQINNLRQIQDFYGVYRGFELVGTRVLSPRTRNFYLVLDYDYGPLFAKFSVYRSEQGWVLTAFTFNTKDELIFPSDLGTVAQQ